MKHFAARQRESAGCLKRGGGREAASLDDEEAVEVADTSQKTPDAKFDRQWAITVLARGLEGLRLECKADGREPFFDLVKPLLTGDSVRGDQGGLASACGMNLQAFRMAVHRLKKRLRQCVKAEVAGTLDDPEMVQEEMQTLFRALGG